MSERRPLGTGPVPTDIRAREADLSAELPGERWAEVDELRARGLFGVPRGNSRAAVGILHPLADECSPGEQVPLVD